jgi:hypothetical protein
MPHVYAMPAAAAIAISAGRAHPGWSGGERTARPTVACTQLRSHAVRR